MITHDPGLGMATARSLRSITVRPVVMVLGCNVGGVCCWGRSAGVAAASHCQPLLVAAPHRIYESTLNEGCSPRCGAVVFRSPHF